MTTGHAAEPRQGSSTIFMTEFGVGWTLACSQDNVQAPLTQFLEIADLLLEQVQLNSTHLFRADILHDSAGKLETLGEKEAKTNTQQVDVYSEDVIGFNGFKHDRTVIRKLIPRKPQLDNPLEQTCLFYSGETAVNESLVVYLPHCESAETMPWYHPQIKGLAYRFSSELSSLAVYYLPFPDTASPIPERLSRTFISLLSTMLRLLKLPPKQIEVVHDDVTRIPLTAASLKDTILPQHVVQDTYSTLKQKYASDLISRWVESTEPTKHVFEDISIAAFLIELWKSKYSTPEKFPGFVDLACGNGVLTYLLISEGWNGYGFDARARKTWQILDLGDHLQEKLCIPGPFFDSLPPESKNNQSQHFIDGKLPPGTFIISNHADELTCWTPILATLSDPASPLPFLAIPCCSHAVDGSKYRYTINDVHVAKQYTLDTNDNEGEGSRQSHTGDLKTLRAEKQKAANHTDDKSQYACLTRKTAAIAQELGFDVQLTLMRIPSTRNIGVLGNCRIDSTKDAKNEATKPTADRIEQVHHLLKRECSKFGGLDTAAKTWIEKAQKLQAPKGRGKFNEKWSHLKHPAIGSDMSED